MSPLQILIALLCISSIAYYLGRRRALKISDSAGGVARLHSRPTYYGALTALWCGIPALIVFGCWLAFDGAIVTDLVVSDLPADIRSLPESRLDLVVNDIRNLVSGNIVAGEIDETMQNAAEHYRQLRSTSHAALAVIVLLLCMAAIPVVRSRITPGLRARNHVEAFLKWLLVGCACIAILTTLGIVLSVLYEAMRFFKVIPVTDFLFGLEWRPQMAIREPP